MQPTADRPRLKSVCKMRPGNTQKRQANPWKCPLSADSAPRQADKCIFYSWYRLHGMFSFPSWVFCFVLLFWAYILFIKCAFWNGGNIICLNDRKQFYNLSGATTGKSGVEKHKHPQFLLSNVQIERDWFLSLGSHLGSCWDLLVGLRDSTEAPRLVRALTAWESPPWEAWSPRTWE